MYTRLGRRRMLLQSRSVATPSAHEDPRQILGSIARVIRCRRGQTLSLEPTEQFWLEARSGIARLCSFDATGRRRIVAFLFTGEVWTITPEDSSFFSVEAVVDDTVLARYPRRAVEALVARDPAASASMCQLAFASARQMERRLLALCKMTATEKVCAFLLDLVERTPANESGFVVLQMSRQDIADYLALTNETVSRTLTALRQRKVIGLPTPREVFILDRARLARPFDEPE
jgi:CRP/FNR family transcriptional regulator, nitrogen fixation regulation protein